MKNKLTLMIGIVLVVILLAYMFTFQVRYDEVAVLTTFDKATPPQRDAQGQLVLNDKGRPVDPGSLIYEPGLRFKAPWPLQKVYTYSRKIHLLEDQPEEIQTADGYAVIVKTYLAWRIEDPYAFFSSLEYVDAAEKQLSSYMRDIKSVITSYPFDALVNTDPSKMKLREIEEKAAQQLRERLSHANPPYGIAVEQVGIRRIVLPEETTEKVFERMRKTRERLAQRALSEGDAKAATITSEARSAQERILAFAERRAQAIRDEGDREAASYFANFQQDEDFAIFLRQIEALKEMLAHNSTFILDANNLSVLELFKHGPTPAGNVTADMPTPAPAPSNDAEARR